MKKVKWLFLLLFLFSCSTQGQLKTYLREGVDPSFIKRVAILKFENHSDDRNAAEKLRSIVGVEALALGVFDVVEKSLVDEALAQEGIEEPGPLSKEVIRRLGKKLGVQALLVGDVTAFEEKRDGRYVYPVVGLTLRLLDVASGEIIWEASGTETGYSLVARLFGLRPKDKMDVSFKLVEKLLKTLK